MAALVLLAVALPGAGFSAFAEAGGTRIDAATPGSGKTVVWGLSRSGSAGISGGTCGSRLQCFKNGITQANTEATPFVENAALVMINVAVPDPADGSLDFGFDDFTVEAWIKPTASDERTIVSKRSLTAAEPYWELTVTDDPDHNGQIRAIYFDGTNTRTAYSGNGVLGGAWHHVVAWFDRDVGITLWVDGATRLTPLLMTPDVGNTGELLIGKAATHPYYKGDLDEVALYAGLLPVARAQAHADAA